MKEHKYFLFLLLRMRINISLLNHHQNSSTTITPPSDVVLPHHHHHHWTTLIFLFKKAPTYYKIGKILKTLTTTFSLTFRPPQISIWKINMIFFFHIMSATKPLYLFWDRKTFIGDHRIENCCNRASRRSPPNFCKDS